MNEFDELKWMDEKIDHIKGQKFFYFMTRLVTFTLRKKLSYKEMFLIYYSMYMAKFGDSESKRLALKRVTEIYKENNNGKEPIEI